MSEHPNIALLRRANEAFQKGDFDALRALWHEDAVWHSSGRNWLVGDYRGVNDIMEFFEMVFIYSEGTYKTQIHDMLANDRRAISLQRSAAHRRDGRKMSVDAFVTFDIVDGKVKEAWACPFDIYEEDQFYGLQPPPGLSAPPKVALAGPHYWHEGRLGMNSPILHERPADRA